MRKDGFDLRRWDADTVVADGDGNGVVEHVRSEQDFRIVGGSRKLDGVLQQVDQGNAEHFRICPDQSDRASGAISEVEYWPCKEIFGLGVGGGYDVDDWCIGKIRLEGRALQSASD